MPQLDVATFINQYLWILGSITSIIILTTVIILPSIKKLIEARAINANDDYLFVVEKKFPGLKKLLDY
uniref:ATP synthase F0 subunit 8 n=1 Tax=Phyllorhiza punctata TaxID=493932 RepID=UPI002A7F3329|nr:ATP synthase F0 subunit 8 [Phyllorhiza punctata]WOE91019.1 ATP synthase F0 subunit 8 [Phyllorhiza punctata]